MLCRAVGCRFDVRAGGKGMGGRNRWVARSGGGCRGQVAAAFFPHGEGEIPQLSVYNRADAGRQTGTRRFEDAGGRLFCCAEADGTAGFFLLLYGMLSYLQMFPVHSEVSHMPDPL